jgi:hypothetical protein
MPQRDLIRVAIIGGHRELPARWLTVEQNQQLTARGADRAPLIDPDGHAGHRALEIFAALLSIEWG